MKLTWTNIFIIMLAACVVAAAGCATKPKAQNEATPAVAEGGATPAEEGAQDQGLDELAKERKTSAQVNYQHALDLHNQKKDAEALVFAEEAAKLNGADKDIQRLLVDIRNALGANAAPASHELEQVDAQRQMLQRDMKEELARGEKNLGSGNYADAIVNFKEALRIIRVGSLLFEAADVKARATELLRQAVDKKREQDVVEQRKRDEAARAALESLLEQKEKEKQERLKQLWIQYEAYKSHNDYERAGQILQAMMVEDAQNKGVYLRDIEALEAARAEWEKRETYRDLETNMQMVMNNILESSVPPEKVFSYGDREEWRSWVLKRAERIAALSMITTTRSEADRKVAELVQQEYATDFSSGSILTRRGPGSPPDLVDIVGTLKKLYPDIPFDIDVNLLGDQAASQPIKDLDLPGRIKLTSLLNQICTQLITVAWRVERGSVMFMRKEDAAELIVRPYDVSDIIATIQDFPGAQVRISSGTEPGTGGGAPVPLGGTTENVNSVNEFKMANLMELIQKTTGGGEANWATDPKETNRPYIQNYYDKLLYIRQTDGGHVEIETLLKRLRSLSSLLVNIEARFITVEKRFLQAVGIDWRDLGPIDPLQLLRVLTSSGGAGGQQAGAALPDTSHDIPGLQGVTSGIFWSDKRADMGARIENILSASIADNNLDSTGGTSIQVQILDRISFEAIIHAVRKDTRRQLLTAPKITCFNAQQASMFVGKSQTYIRTYQTGVGGVNKPVLDLVDGPTVVFDVRPVVSADRRYITLFLRPSITFKPTFSSIHFTRGIDPVTKLPIDLTVDLPVLAREDVRTVVMVPDGGTVLIGGLKTAEDDYSKSEVPVLGKLPLVGFFFRSEATAKQDQELLILVTAKIIAIDEQEAEM
jgi:type II secretory pathway component GspD/PulD (secretin)/tetratricopeptide (TPR) repeat protein